MSRLLSIPGYCINFGLEDEGQVWGDLGGTLPPRFSMDPSKNV